MFYIQVDIFSYGVMLVHVLSGEWPFPGEAVRVNPRNPNDPNDLVGVTEFDRREEYINKIDNQHPLIHLIQVCLSNNPSHRPTSCKVHQQVSAVSAEHPASFANRVEMLERIKVLGEEKEAIRMEKNNALTEKDEQVVELRRKKEQVSAELEESQSSIERIQQSYSIELEGVRLEVSDLKAQIEHLQTIVNTKGRELEALKESKRHLEGQHKFQLELKISELSSKDALISSKSTTIQSLQEKLRLALGTSSSSKYSLNLFTPGTYMNFIECGEVPLTGGFGQAIAAALGNEVYVGFESGPVLKHIIAEESWSSLSEAPVKYFSIGYIFLKAVLVGGRIQSNLQVLSDIHEFDETTQQWVRSTSIPPMPTARTSATVVSWTSPPALIVCGGSDEHGKPTSVVEVYHSRTSQWHTVGPLPFPRDYMSQTVVHNVLYLVGGYEENTPGSFTRSVISVSISQLLEFCLQSSRAPPVQWQSGSIPDVPHYGMTAASLGGCLLVMGGITKPNKYFGETVSSVHAYCPSSSSWVCVGELPQPLAMCITVTLPTGELLVLGGRSSQRKVSKTTYKCCLSLKDIN